MKYLKILFPILGSILILALLSCAKNELQPREGYFNMPDGKIWYEIHGTGKKTPVIAIHGGPGGTSCYMSPNIKLGSERSIIFYDQLGSGRSDVTTDTSLWNLQNFVNNLDKLIDSLKIQEVHLLGHSWGCAVAVEYYLITKNTKVKSLLLAGTYLSTKLWIEDANILRSQLPDSIKNVLSFHENRGSVDSKEYKDATRYFYNRHLIRTNPWPKYSECDSVLSNGDIYNYMWGPSEFYSTGTLINYSSIDRLGEIDIPVLLVAGEYDEARPETVSKLQHLFPDAKFETIEDAAHVMYIDKPDEFNNVVKDFLASVE